MMEGRQASTETERGGAGEARKGNGEGVEGAAGENYLAGFIQCQQCSQRHRTSWSPSSRGQASVQPAAA